MQEAEKPKKEGKGMDTSKFGEDGKVVKEFAFIGPLGGVGPLPPHFKMHDLVLFKPAEENILAATWINDFGETQ